jgi:hypothetical protein
MDDIGHVLFSWVGHPFFLLNCALLVTDSTSAFPTGRQNNPDPTLIDADLEPAFNANLQHRPLDHPRLQGTSSVLSV